MFVTKKAVPLQPLSGTKPSFVLGEREEIFERLDKKDVVQDMISTRVGIGYRQGNIIEANKSDIDHTSGID